MRAKEPEKERGWVAAFQSQSINKWQKRHYFSIKFLSSWMGSNTCSCKVNLLNFNSNNMILLLCLCWSKATDWSTINIFYSFLYLVYVLSLYNWNQAICIHYYILLFHLNYSMLFANIILKVSIIAHLNYLTISLII